MDERKSILYPKARDTVVRASVCIVNIYVQHISGSIEKAYPVNSLYIVKYFMSFLFLL